MASCTKIQSHFILVLNTAESNIIPSSCLGDLVAAFDHHRSIFGQVDICINNAGVAEKPSDSFYEDKSGDGKGSWRRVMDINLTAVIDGTRLAVRRPFFCFKKFLKLGYGYLRSEWDFLSRVGPLYFFIGCYVSNISKYLSSCGAFSEECQFLNIEQPVLIHRGPRLL